MGGESDYQKAEEALTNHFVLQVNSTFQNHLFRSMEQQENETVAQFVTRLKREVKDCNYGGQSDNQIRDQVVQKCRSAESVKNC